MAGDPIAFELFGHPIYKYGLIVTAAIVCAFLLFLLLAKKRKIEIDFSLEMFIWVVLLAVLCCRLFYVIPRKEFFPDDFGWKDFVRIFDISTGGLTIIGGIFGGALGIFFCCLRYRKYSFAKVADCVVIALLLGQIIGRWGNFFNQELYGKVITNPDWQFFPFAVYIDVLGEWCYALFFIEGCINAVGLIVALIIFYKLGDKLKPFTIALGYIAWYNLVRASLEFLKYDHLTFPGTNVGVIQVICFIVAPIAIILCVLNQLGIIKFESKWFANMCEKHQAKLAQKLALAEGKADNEINENSNLDESHKDDLDVEENKNVDEFASTETDDSTKIEVVEDISKTNEEDKKDK